VPHGTSSSLEPKTAAIPQHFWYRTPTSGEFPFSPFPLDPLLWENSYSEGFILLFEGGFPFLEGFTLPLPQEGFIPPFQDNSQF